MPSTCQALKPLGNMQQKQKATTDGEAGPAGTWHLVTRVIPASGMLCPAQGEEVYAQQLHAQQLIHLYLGINAREESSE